MDIQGKKIIVVGGSSGIGLGVAQAALAKGAEVTIVGRSQERLEQAAAEMAYMGSVSTIAADATREDEVARLFESVGSFDHLFVSAAAHLAYQPVREFNLEAARMTIEVKLIAALLLAKYAARQINEHGSLTFTAGIAAERPMPTAAMVAAVNGGLFSFTYALAIGLAPIRVNAISPGSIDTPLWDTTFGAQKQPMLARVAQNLPVKRIGRPSDIGHAAIFLMENEFTTATILPVDGGQRVA